MNSLTTRRFHKSAITLFALALVPIPFADTSLACRQAAVEHSGSLITPQSPGDLDPSFGNNGVLQFSISDQGTTPNSMAVQQDGKIVIGGQYGVLNQSGTVVMHSFLARVNTDGIFDPGFGTNGIVTLNLNSGGDAINTLKLQADGKIVFAGSASNSAGGTDFIVGRTNSDGSMDSSFGAAGFANHTGGQALCMDIRSGDGEIAVGGATSVAGGTSNDNLGDAVVLDPSGSPAPAFQHTALLGGVNQISGGVTSLAWVAATTSSPEMMVGCGRTADRSEILVARFDGITGAPVLPNLALHSELPADSPSLTIAGPGPLAPSSGAIARTDVPTGEARSLSTTKVDFATGAVGVTVSVSVFQNGVGEDLSVSSSAAFPGQTGFVIAGSAAVSPAGSRSVGSLEFFDWNLTPVLRPGPIITRFSQVSRFTFCVTIPGAVSSSMYVCGISAAATDSNDMGAESTIAQSSSPAAVIMRMQGMLNTDFLFSFAQPVITAMPGDVVPVAVNISRLGGLTGDVTITAPSDLPKTIKIKGGPSFTTSDSTISFKLRLKPGTQPGNYPLTFTGNDSAGQNHTARLTLIVN
jgi:uncharacterized delta-60 repeat protein